MFAINESRLVFRIQNDKLILRNLSMIKDPFAKRWDQCKHGYNLCLHWRWSSDEAWPVMIDGISI